MCCAVVQQEQAYAKVDSHHCHALHSTYLQGPLSRRSPARMASSQSGLDRPSKMKGFAHIAVGYWRGLAKIHQCTANRPI